MADETVYNDAVQNLTANGSSDAKTHDGNGLLIYVVGTYDGTVIVQSTPDNTVWTTEATLTASAPQFFVSAGVPRGVAFRVNISGASSVDLDVITFKGGAL